MAQQEPGINTNDVSALMGIFKKLGLSIPKVLAAQTYLNSSKYTPEEKARKLFGVKDEEELSAFMEERLSKYEIEVIRRNLGV